MSRSSVNRDRFICISLLVTGPTQKRKKTRTSRNLARRWLTCAVVMASEKAPSFTTQRRRFGYRHLHIMLAPEGILVKQKKLRRLYREEQLQVRHRGGHKRALGTRAPMVPPDGPNQYWSLDFVSDALEDSRQVRILCIVGDFTRECIGRVADTPLSGVHVARELNAIVRHRCKPLTVVNDKGAELTSMAILKRSQDCRIGWHHIAPGKPTQNAFVESFNPISRSGTMPC